MKAPSRALLIAAHNSGNRRRWIVYREAGRIFGNYSRGENSTASLAAELAVSSDTIGNWARAGWLRQACRGLTYTDETGKVWTFYDLRKSLPTAHFQIAGKALDKEAAGPEDIVEWLGIAATERKSAEWLAAQLMPGEEEPEELAPVGVTPPEDDDTPDTLQGWIDVFAEASGIDPKDLVSGLALEVKLLREKATERARTDPPGTKAAQNHQAEAMIRIQRACGKWFSELQKKLGEHGRDLIYENAGRIAEYSIRVGRSILDKQPRPQAPKELEGILDSMDPFEVVRFGEDCLTALTVNHDDLCIIPGEVRDFFGNDPVLYLEACGWANLEGGE